VEAGRVEALGGGVVVALDYVRGQYVRGERVWVAEEVGEGHCRERVVVAEGGLVKFDHCSVMDIVGC